MADARASRKRGGVRRGLAKALFWGGVGCVVAWAVSYQWWVGVKHLRAGPGGKPQMDIVGIMQRRAYYFRERSPGRELDGGSRWRVQTGDASDEDMYLGTGFTVMWEGGRLLALMVPWWCLAWGMWAGAWMAREGTWRGAGRRLGIAVLGMAIATEAWTWIEASNSWMCVQWMNPGEVPVWEIEGHEDGLSISVTRSRPWGYSTWEWGPFVTSRDVGTTGEWRGTAREWVLMPGEGGVLAWLGWREVRGWRKQGAREGACPACGYDWRVSPGRCPECGLGREGGE